MLKQMFVLICLSIAIIFSMSYAQQIIQLLIHAHDWISQILTDVFSGGQAGNLTRGLISLLSVPVAIGLITTIVYWMVKRNWFPYFMEVVWIVWLVQAGALLMMYKNAGI